MIGKTINNYVIERKLGDGGMGDVYYAKHNKVDREVAIKVLHSYLFSNENIHNRFKNEANALIKLNHPNIVKIFDYVEQDNFAYLIMEYINGYTLDDYISKLTGPLPSAKATSIICSVLDAVQYAHDNHVFHRDIKPSNIMISQDGNNVRIMDFGIAKLTDSKNFKTTHANTQLGTPFYMSPELIKGLTYSRTSDIYSLGVTLFEMVTGKCPYHGITSLFELQSKIVNEPLPRTSDYYPGVSKKIQTAIIKATQKKPELRFQNCNEFKKYLLENESFDLTTIATKPHIVNQVKSKTNAPVYIVAGLALLVLIVLTSLLLPKKSGTVESKPEYTPLSAKVININDTIISSTSDTLQAPSIQDQNLAILKTYINNKLSEAYTSLPDIERTKMVNKIQVNDQIITTSVLSAKYDRCFVVKVPIKIPGDEQILKDFWNDLHQKKTLCRTIYDADSQISGIHIANNYTSSKNPPRELSITIEFTITSSDDESDKTNCSATLKYSKSKNGYTLIR